MIKQVLITGLIMMSVIFLIQLPDMVSEVLNLAKITERTPNSIRFDTSKLEPGDYYLSMGRPKGQCEINLDGKVIDKNYSKSTLRDNLLLGSPFEITDPISSTDLRVECKIQSGIRGYLSNEPLLMRRTAGLFVQGYRAFFQIFFGPLIGFFCLIFIGFLNGSRKYVPLVLVGIPYLLSSSHYPRLFLTPWDASILHIESRYIFIMLMFTSFDRTTVGKLLASTYSLLICVFFYLWISENQILNEVYRLSFYFAALTLAILTFRVWKTRSFEDLTSAATAILLMWTLDQPLMLYQVFYSGAGETVAYMMPLGTIILISFRAFADKKFSLVINSIRLERNRFFSEVGEDRDIGVSLQRFFNVLPYLSLVKLSYRNKIKLSNESVPCGHDQLMAISATSKQTEIQVVFLKQVSSELKAVFVEELENIVEFINSIYERKDHLAKSAFELALERLCNADCNEVNVFSILADINDFSRNVQRYGDAYTGFVQNDFHKILKSVIEPSGVVEYVRGDEILIHYVPIANETEKSTLENGLKVYKIFENFMKTDLVSSCIDKGFDSISVSSGVGMGLCKISNAETLTSLSGPHFIQIRRLATAAAMDQSLVSAPFARKISLLDHSFVFGDEFPVQVKKDFLFCSEIIGFSLGKESA